MDEKFEALQNNLGYHFKDISLLRTALTHSSYANEKGAGTVCNERLEFLGDSVLGFISAGYFYRNYDSALLLGKGELRMGGREKPSILADAFEAVLAAVYLDGGLEEASKLALRFVARNDSIQETKDYKTILQEIIQRNPEEHIEYVLTGSSGPDHAKSFNVEVHLNSNVIGRGVGRTKKLAEQHAAKEALELMGIK